MIRPAHHDDIEAIRGVERAAGAPFRAIGMTAVADDPPPTASELAPHLASGTAWVVDDGDGPCAYVLAEIVDGGAHLAQVSVHPRCAGRRIGAALTETVDRWAADRGLGTLTLTSFAEVPWNAPYYARLGFHVLDDAELGTELREIVRREAYLAPTSPRVAMARPTGGV
ncbi:GNAT family N-acetyltransferase [Rhodococcus rhodnii]|uniref:GNAT family N-acetyltransferase n=1 Tax=Rhodococcus rhodnii TaxID=38312 RepID=A0A6P2CJD7_9NOCA|nr:GNAT family N-acetyltransferase [Rhodococcus rhodnii]